MTRRRKARDIVDKSYEQAVRAAQRALLQANFGTEKPSPARVLDRVAWDDAYNTRAGFGLPEPQDMTDEALERANFERHIPRYMRELERRVRTKRRIEHKRAYMKAYYSAKRKSLTT